MAETTIIDLCSGYGMLSTAVEIACDVAGLRARTVCYVERETSAAAAIVARMEASDLCEAPIWSDVATFDGAAWRGCVDILTAGYPCQDFSVAGKRAGMQGDRGGVWHHVRRVIEESQPRLVFLENVRGHLSLGFDAVVSDLRGLGYDVRFGLFSAAEVGAPHERQRLFILAELANLSSELCSKTRSSNIRRGLFTNFSSEVAKSSGKRRERPEQQRAHEARTGAPGSIAEQRLDVVNTTSKRKREPNNPTCTIPWKHSWENTGGASMPIFPPHKDDYHSWSTVSELDPTKMPAIESGVSALANGVAAYWPNSELLRIGGNGVVTMAAAYAFITLCTVG